MLADHQCAIINAALEKDSEGMFKYNTVLYSAIKKSGKSTLSAAVHLYIIEHTPFGEGYCLANDKGQGDRIYGPIVKNFELHRQLGGIYKDNPPNWTLQKAKLPNFATTEPIPCDPRGEAGSEPTVTTISEAWGWIHDYHTRLWTETTIPSTRYGRAIRWVESYAGYIGQSNLLYGLYEEGVVIPRDRGWRHPQFDGSANADFDLPVYINEDAGLFTYWDEEPRMVWQLGEAGKRYYQSEAKIIKDPSEFNRIHKNQWQSPIGAFLERGWWDSCLDPSIPPLTSSKTPVVIAIDAATEGDCAAMVAVTRHHLRPETDVAVRACRIFSPKLGSINIQETIGKTLIEWYEKGWNIICVAYDRYEMKNLIQNFQRGSVTFTAEEMDRMSETEQKEHAIRIRKLVQNKYYYEFGQQNPRAEADKMLKDKVMSKEIWWNNDPEWDIGSRGEEETLYKHMQQAGVKISANGMRIEKLSDSTKVDGAVALSMAVNKCMELLITNRELNQEDLIQQLQRGEISLEEFNSILASRKVVIKG